MATYPALSLAAASATAVVASPQRIQHSLYGSKVGVGSTDTLITPSGYPAKPEAGAMIVATTADIIGNYGTYKTSSSAVSAIFTVADPVPGAELTLILNGTASTAIRFQTPSSNVTFSATSESFAVGAGSSLFFTAAALTLVGMSTGAYRVKSYHNNVGSSILLAYTTI